MPSARQGCACRKLAQVDTVIGGGTGVVSRRTAAILVVWLAGRWSTFQGKKIGVTVPAYNEESHVGSVIRNMPSWVDRIYIVNDGSTDGTGRVVCATCQDNARVKLIDHATNKGVGAAIVAGYKKCLEDGMDIAVVMAGDNQMDPSELPRLLAPITAGHAGYSKGNRMSTRGHVKGMPLWRRFGNWVLRWATMVSSGNYHVMDPQNGYAAASAEALHRIDLDRLYPRYGYCNHILAELAMARVRTVEVPMPARYQGERSKIRYSEYIPRVSWLLLSILARRMRMKLLCGTQRQPDPERIRPACRTGTDG